MRGFPTVLGPRGVRNSTPSRCRPQLRSPAARDFDKSSLEKQSVKPLRFVVRQIFQQIGKRFGLWPSDPIAEAKALSLIGFFAASVHPAHAHIGRPERYATDPSAYPTLQEAGRKAFHGYLKQIDGMLAARPWLADKYSVLDPYGFVFYTWGVRRELPMQELKSYSSFKDRMLERPAVRRVVEDEKIKV